LKRDPANAWKVKDGADNGLFSMVYFFNFGSYHNQKCKGNMVAVSEVLEVLKQPTETCEVLGRIDAATFGLLNENDPKAGMYVMYGNGDRCTNSDNHAENGQPRKSKFKLYCAEKEDSNFVLDLPGNTQGTTKCTLEFKILTPAGCPGGSYGFGKRPIVILFWILLGFFCYFVIGTIFNMKKNELSGKDAIPNIEFWREFPTYVQEGFAGTINGCKNLFSSAKEKFSGKSSYNEL